MINFKSSKLGFTLIEIIVVMLVISILATISLPYFSTGPKVDPDEFVVNLNNITRQAVAEALRTQKNQKIIFNFEQNKVETDFGANISIPEELEFNDLYVANKQEQDSGRAYFLINSEGMSQEVRVNMINTQSGNSFLLTLNPFTSRFRLI